MKDQLQPLRDKIARLYQLVGEPMSIPEVPRVTVLLGGSRSGSSLLFHLLAESGAFVSPQGEETPFYRLAGVGAVRNIHESDRLEGTPTVDVRTEALRFLGADLGGESTDDLGDGFFHAQVGSRLLLQWPELDLTPEALLKVIADVNRRDVMSFWTELLTVLKRDATFYDSPGLESRPHRSRLAEFLFEEPPFVIQRPRVRADFTKPLLLKTSSNAYRISWLRGLFPRAEFRFIVLGRNPAAAINGLMDGWLSGGFHSHNLGGVQPLAIRGYSDVVPEGDRWWKFDLPPGWAEMAHASLAEVCAFQWHSAYAAILQQPEVLPVKYEDLLRPELASSVLDRIFAYAGTQPLRRVLPSEVQPIMASATPGVARWRARESELWPLVHETRIRRMGETLGYDFSVAENLA